MDDQPNVHTFLPAVTMREREDGRYDVELLFDNSYNGSYQEESGEFFDDAGNGPHTPAGARACKALDEWLKRPQTTTRFIIDGPKEA